MSARIGWSGVFPAVTIQFREDFSLDVDATARVIDHLIRDGVSGLVPALPDVGLPLPR